ncbi:hypothetical protein [Methanonatronarchaeum sp. AMET-Sl]|uniref:hypothetical protein n=1 Tax=Methanonatronarchaeum sp. AMET-Sl TaxID=3037654 RepID=UPI00244E42EC|nr:hypothetical protein [Methanonatronarchaeum sp. AMET-Sl]WGI17129.1 hypothetical protein QEN48_06410 [Methanonatronarchaeum sp. AMET-Sl]
MSGKDNLAWSSLELQTKINEDTETLHNHTGLLNPKDRYNKLLEYISNNYNNIQKETPTLTNHQYQDLRIYREILKNRSSRYVGQALQTHNIPVIKRIAGNPPEGNDLSGLRTLQLLENRLRQEIYICYIAGNMGSGKTDFAILLAELYHTWLNGKVASNIKSFKEKDRYCSGIQELETWLKSDKQEGQKQSNKLFIFDEASSHASGYSKDSTKVERQFSTLLKKFRKYRASLIIIGHTGKDVHPDIRRLLNDYILKVGRKEAIFYRSVTDAKGRGQRFKLQGIPKTNYTFNTYENTEWKWKDSEIDERLEPEFMPEIKRAKEVVHQIQEKGIDEYVNRYKKNYHPGMEEGTIKSFRKNKIIKDYKINKKVYKFVQEDLRDIYGVNS